MINKAIINKIALDFFWRKRAAKIAGFFWEQRARRNAKYLLPHILESERIIDIGSGSGMIAKVISERIPVDFILVDVIDWNITDFPLVLFDGEHIPFPGNAFDVALLIDVLHHSEKEKQLLKEALRVAKKVIIVEEVHHHPKMDLLANISDNLQWFLYGMPLGIHHRNKKQWVEFLRQYSPCVECDREYWNHAIFVMQKNQGH